MGRRPLRFTLYDLPKTLQASIIESVRLAHSKPYSHRSLWVDNNPVPIALACQLGFLTMMLPNGEITRRWHTTKKGLQVLEEHNDLLNRKLKK